MLKKLFNWRPAQPGAEAEFPGDAPASEKSIDEQFEALINDLGLPEEKRKEMQNMRPEQKIQMLGAYHASQNAGSPGCRGSQRRRKSLTNMQALVAGFEQPDPEQLNQFVKTLGVDLRTQPLSWIELFFEAGGLVTIVNKLEELRVVEAQSAVHAKLEHGLTRCLKASLNNRVGAEEAIRTPELTPTLTLLLDNADLEVCTMALEMLAALTDFSAEGFQSVLEAFDFYRITKNQPVRFLALIEKVLSDMYSFEFKRDILLLINVMVSEAPDVEQRCRIRTDLVFGGITRAHEMYSALLEDAQEAEEAGVDAEAGAKNEEAEAQPKGLADDIEFNEMLEQFRIFEAQMEEDDSTMTVVVNDEEVVMSDPEQIFTAVYTATLQHSCYDHFLAILRYLLLVPYTSQEGVEMIRSVERSLQGILMPAYGERFGDSAQADKFKQMFDVKASTDKLALLVDRQKQQINKLQTFRRPSTLSTPLPRGELKQLEDSVMAALRRCSEDADDKHGPDNGRTAQKAAVETREVEIQTDHVSFEKSQPAAPATPANTAAPSTASPPPPAPTAIPVPPPLPGAPVAPVLPKATAPPPMPPPLPGMSAAPPVPPPLPGMSAAPPVPPPLPGMSAAPPIPPPLPGMARLPVPPPLPGAPVAPPPLPGMSGLPAPPPLPGMMGLPRAPPPLPGLAGLPRGPVVPAKPAKPSVAPSVPLRNLYWSKVPDNKIAQTVWSNLDDSGVELERSELEQLFAKDKKKEAEETSAKHTSTPALNKPKEINLLDPKTLQNAGIGLARLRMTPQQIKEAVMSMSPEMTAENVMALRRIAPSVEDMSTISQYDGDPAALGKVEQFYLEIMSIPDFAKRLDCWIYKLRFDTAKDGLVATIKTVSDATTQVKESAKLQRLLEVVLAIGNFLNGGTSRGGLYGFKLDALSKLATVKSTDKKTTLMNYLVSWCEKHDSALLQFPSDVDLAEDASRVSLNQWKTDFAAFTSGWKLVSQQLEHCNEQDSGKDQFAQVMKPFRDDAQSSIDELEKRADAVMAELRQLIQSFGETPSQNECEDFFGLIHQFAQHFNSARIENKKQAERAAKAAAKRPSVAVVAAAVAVAAAAKAKESNHEKSDSLVDNVFGRLKAQQQSNSERWKSQQQRPNDGTLSRKSLARGTLGDSESKRRNPTLSKALPSEIYTTLSNAEAEVGRRSLYKSVKSPTADQHQNELLLALAKRKANLPTS